MPQSRITLKHLPVSAGKDQKFHIKYNSAEGRHWIYYIPPGRDPIPADDPHIELVDCVNRLKVAERNQPGGSFSINEHGQVIARMTAASGNQRAWHVVDVASGSVFEYTQTITFLGGTLDPNATPTIGTSWPGPLCGTTYSFAAPDSPKPPSHNLDEIRIEVDGMPVLLSIDANIAPYPPTTGPLAVFLADLRRWCPAGGRFRVNEKRRAFTSDTNIFVGIVPDQPNWFRPILPTD